MSIIAMTVLNTAGVKKHEIREGLPLTVRRKSAGVWEEDERGRWMLVMIICNVFMYKRKINK